jgi:outer membrane protein insertion porin family
VTDKALLKKTDLKEGDALNTYSVEMARQKIEEFYHSKGYRTTEVSIVEGNRAGDRGVRFLVNEGNLERVWDVRFVGNTIATDSRLETLIQSRPGYFKYLFRGRVDYAKIDQDVDRLTAYYRSLGFFQAKVGRELDLSESSLGTWLTVNFIIREGPRAVVRNISIVGNQQYSSEELLAEAGLKPGEYFNLGLMNRDLASLRDYYGGRGYIFADIQADPRVWEDAGQMDLVYTIEEGAVYRVGRINVHIDGEFSHTRNNVVLNRLSLQPGDIIDIREVRDSERRLKASQLFLNEPARGVTPRIVVRPPELKDLEKLAREGGDAPRTTRYRGQSPDPPERVIDLNVFVSPP